VSGPEAVSDIFVTDTHALIWHMTGQARRLGRRARALFHRADHGDGVRILIPVLVLAEVLEARRMGGIELSGGFTHWVDHIEAHPGFSIVSLSTEVVLLSAEMMGIPERPDRLIAATAVHLGYPLITRDPEIRADGLTTVWS
jgi:PIN domain nuclease of toxin-antitoxin system